MADMERQSPLAPTAVPPERVGTVYEAKMAPDAPGGRGPLRFEAGLATDTDIPNEFVIGMRQGYDTPPGEPNHNANVYFKYADEVMRERAHLGSAAWVDAPSHVQAFAEGAGPEAERRYIEVDRDGGRYLRINPCRVID